MDVRDEALNSYLHRLRREAGLSLEQVCERTKIQARFVEALEDGRYGELPSNTHLRAFSLSLAQACGGDAETAALLVRRIFSAVAAPGEGPPPEASPSPPASARPVPLKPMELKSPRSLRVELPVASAVALPQPEVSREAAEAAEGMIQGASQRLRALPWQAALALVGGAAILSAALIFGVRRWQQPPLAEAPVGNPAAVTAAPVTKSPAVAETSAAAAAPVASSELILRARRPCWLVLQLDGQRLPTVTLQDGDKRSWPVTQRAVLLAGNIGALRVWWRGDNLGYLGELGTRANGLVFEPGKAVHVDKAAHLALPAGVPE